MRQPLWAINSSFLLLFVVGQLVFFLLYTPIPRRVSLEPDVVSMPEKKVSTVVSIKNIYEQNDLFGTYVPPMMPLAKAIDLVIPEIPEAPVNIPLTIPLEPEKIFIAPLAVTLKGVMYAYDRPDHSIAVIQFQDSKEEINYRVGQLINDAQILKIYPNRVVVVRSNGQQETLFLREDEASKDLALEMSKDIGGIMIPFKNGQYHVPMDKFIEHVKSLGQFIELLDLTTVYKQGKSVGCRVGKAGKDSLGNKLGFMKDDIVQHVDTIPVSDIASRVLAFDHIIQKKVGDVITVGIDRGGRNLQLKYLLLQSTQNSMMPTLQPQVKSAKTVAVDQQAENNLEEQRKKLLEQKVKLAPTAYQLEMAEQRKLFEARRRDLFAQVPKSTAGLSPQYGPTHMPFNGTAISTVGTQG